MERFTVLRFSFSSCSSQSSVDVVENPSKKSKLDPSSSTIIQGGAEKEDRLKVKNSSNKFHTAIQKSNDISIGIQRIIKRFKSFSQIFVYKDEEEEDDDEEDMEMEIGLPTDVKHVAHIGWDGSTTTTKSNTTLSNNALKDCFLWESNLNGDDDHNKHQNESLSNNTSISLRQFELAMAAQANNNNNGHDATTTTQPLIFGFLKKPITTPTPTTY